MQPNKSAPDDRGTGRWIVVSGQVAAESCQLYQVVRQRAGRASAAWTELVQHFNFDFGEGQSRAGFGLGAVDHRHPEHAPTHDAIDRDQVGKPLGRLQARVFCLASGFQDLVERLNLPTHRVPVDLLDGLGG